MPSWHARDSFAYRSGAALLVVGVGVGVAAARGGGGGWRRI